MRRFRVETITLCAILAVLSTISLSKIHTNNIVENIVVKYRHLELRNKELDQENEKLKTLLNQVNTSKEISEICKIPTPPKTTKGMQNNNPLNIVAMNSKNPWYGQIGKDSHNRAIFDSYEHGIRAAYVTLRGFYLKHKLDTPIAITSRFCESSQEKYAKFIGKQLGIKHDEQFNVLERMPELLKAMIHFENGFQPFPDSMFVAYYSR